MKTRRTDRRRGLSVVFAVLCLVALFSMAALAIDIAYLFNARAELQRSADAAALAACWEMGEQFALGNNDVGDTVRTEAANAAGRNDVCNAFPTLDNSDVEFGYLANINDRQQTLNTSNPARFNAVTVRVRRNSVINGRIATFFAKAMGVSGINAQASATAVILREIEGFKPPADGSNLDILPFALDEVTWDAMLQGNATDSFTWNPDAKQVQLGSDTILEVNLYPQGTGAPGNRGTVDIGGSNNSTADIARQIVSGISPSDIAAMGGSLKFDSNGELSLNGDTGISAAMNDELTSIIGEIRCVPIFRSVQGPGNNAVYTIVKWCGVRVMDVKLTGPKNQKRVIVQPAPCSSRGVIPKPGSTATSEYVFSRAFLIR